MIPRCIKFKSIFLLEDDPFTNESSSINPQVKRATNLTLSSLKFIQALKNETLSVDTLKMGNRYVCINILNYLVLQEFHLKKDA